MRKRKTDYPPVDFSEQSPMQTIADMIIESQKEAIKRNIKANAILINDFLYFSQFNIGLRHVEMICGLKVVPAVKELPDDVAFGLIHADNLPLSLQEKLEKLEEENKALKEKLKSIGEIIDNENQ